MTRATHEAEFFVVAMLCAAVEIGTADLCLCG